MRVTAHHGHAWQRRTVLRADDVHDTLAFGQERKKGGCTKFLDVVVQRGDLLLADHNTPTTGWELGYDGITDLVSKEQITTLDNNIKEFG